MPQFRLKESFYGQTPIIWFTWIEVQRLNRRKMGRRAKTHYKCVYLSLCSVFASSHTIMLVGVIVSKLLNNEAGSDADGAWGLSLSVEGGRGAKTDAVLTAKEAKKRRIKVCSCVCCIWQREQPQESDHPLLTVKNLSVSNSVTHQKNLLVLI